MKIIGETLASRDFFLYLCVRKRETAHARQLVQAPLLSLNRSFAPKTHAVKSAPKTGPKEKD